MRRVVTTLSVLVISASGLVALGPASAVDAAGGGQTTTVWQLVNRHCTGNEVEAGQACFDPAGHAADYIFVGQDEALSTVHGEQQDYTYKLPGVIAAGTDNDVHLRAEVRQVTDGAAHARFCVVGAFQHKGTAEPCATTDEAANGQSLNAHHDITLIPYEAAPGQVVTVTVGFEEPGGYVNFDYKATGHTTTVHYRYRGHTDRPDQDTARAFDIEDHGSFTVVGPLRDDMVGASVDGNAAFQVTGNSGKAHSAHLELRRATYTDPGKVLLHYRVEKSQLSCLPVGRQVEVRVARDDSLHFKVCELNQNDSDKNTTHISTD